MNTLIRAAAAAAIFAAATAQAKVSEQTATGFQVGYEAELPVDRKAAYNAFIEIGSWWDKEHTYSGDAKNLTIDVKPNGCWCEALSDGGFVGHMTVVQAMPGASLMLKGGLGPLAFMGVEGTMVLTFNVQNKRTLVKMSYVVGGYDPKEFKELPKLVDGVLGAAFQRYVQYASGKAS